MERPGRSLFRQWTLALFARESRLAREDLPKAIDDALWFRGISNRVEPFV